MLRALPLLAVLLLLGACTDSPLAIAPDHFKASLAPGDEGTVNGDTCLRGCLDPIRVEVPPSEPSSCEPWNWDHTCDPSVGSSGGGSPGGGGGGGGGDGGDPPPPDPWGGTGETPDPPAADTCNTRDPIIDSKDVHGGFAEIWELSLATNTERGGWIVQQGGKYTLVPFQNATYHQCGIDIDESPPAGTVAMLHTHPWPLFQVDPCGNINTGTPSGEDVAALQLLGLSTGYILDAGGIARYTASGAESANRIARCAF